MTTSPNNTLPDGCRVEPQAGRELDAMPKRIQRRRAKGWRMPHGVVYVGRPTVWGNPFTTVHPGENILETFEAYCTGYLKNVPDWLEPLRGKDLACWCKEGAPCHADVLLKLANE